MDDQNRYLCQFRDAGRDHFTTDCAFESEEKASRYVDWIVESLDSVVEGQVFDAHTREVTYHVVSPHWQ